MEDSSASVCGEESTETSCYFVLRTRSCFNPRSWLYRLSGQRRRIIETATPERLRPFVFTPRHVPALAARSLGGTPQLTTSGESYRASLLSGAIIRKFRTSKFCKLTAVRHPRVVTRLPCSIFTGIFPGF